MQRTSIEEKRRIVKAVGERLPSVQEQAQRRERNSNNGGRPYDGEALLERSKRTAPIRAPQLRRVAEKIAKGEK